MRFLANENFPGDAIRLLELAGHDIVWVRTAAPGISDPDVLAWAARESRILLTFDKDFGELAKVSGLPAACGVILFRMPMPGHSRLDGASPISSWQVTIGQVIFSWPN